MNRSCDSTDLPLGNRLGNYILVGQLGCGHQGTAYRAEEVPTGAVRKLKVMNCETTEDIRHAIQAARVSDALSLTGSIGRYHHLGHAFPNNGCDCGGIYYLVFELLEGRTLDIYISRLRGSMPERQKVASRLINNIADQIARVHRMSYAVGAFELGDNIVVLGVAQELPV